MSVTRIFDISRRSLATYQQAMNVAAHNISNASNKDFTRQRVQLTTEDPDKNANFSWGTGIKLENIERVKDKLIDKQILTNQQNYSSTNKQSILLSQIEEIFSEPSDVGVSSLMNKFFNSWNELSVSPNSIPLRNNVIYAAQNLATKVGAINDDLETVKYDVFEEFQQKVETVNHYLKQINQLNSQIYSMSSVNVNPNDLLDNRDKVIKELSSLVNTTVTYDNKGNATISIGGSFAVDGTSYVEFKSILEDGKLGLAPVDSGKAVNLQAGELHGLSHIYSNKIPEYRENLDTFFTQFVSSINALHSTGQTLESTPRTGINFFKEYKDGKLVIDDEILNDPHNIAISSDGSQGNGDIAIQLAELSTAESVEGTSFENYYSSFISKIGNDKLSVDRNSEASSMVLEQLEQQRSSISGVSVDEEMTEILKFQRAYEASAKLIKIADEMLQSLMNMV